MMAPRSQRSQRGSSNSSLVLLALQVVRFLRVSDLLIDAVHVLVGHRSVKRVLDCVTGHREAPHPRAAVDCLAVGAVADGVEVRPIRLIVDHAPPVLGRQVPHPVVEVGQGVGPLPVAVGHRLAVLLLPPVQIRVEEPMASQDADHQAHGNGGDPPIVVGRHVGGPVVDPLLEEVIRNRGVSLILQQHGVAHAHGEVGPRANGRVRRQVVARAQRIAGAQGKTCPR
mmetsp:Transcript_101157/g.257307  ORF Transcript_101157/g.257307 Transcript_101157/m.257307 type:complete len:226 (+) Transcript_101157:72-749(+)